MNKLALGILSKVQHRVEGITALEYALIATLLPIVLVNAIRTIGHHGS